MAGNQVGAKKTFGSTEIEIPEFFKLFDMDGDGLISFFVNICFF